MRISRGQWVAEPALSEDTRFVQMSLKRPRTDPAPEPTTPDMPEVTPTKRPPHSETGDGAGPKRQKLGDVQQLFTLVPKLELALAVHEGDEPLAVLAMLHRRFIQFFGQVDHVAEETPRGGTDTLPRVTPLMRAYQHALEEHLADVPTQPGVRTAPAKQVLHLRLNLGEYAVGGTAVNENAVHLLAGLLAGEVDHKLMQTVDPRDRFDAILMCDQVLFDTGKCMSNDPVGRLNDEILPR